MSEPISQNPEPLVERSDEFLDVAEKPENAGVFNLSSAQLKQWRDQTNVVQSLLDQRHYFEQQLDGLSAQLKTETPKLETLARGGLGAASKSPASPELKAEAGVNTPKPRVNSKPIIPQKLVAAANTNGTAKLEWDRSGNIKGCKFVVEKRVNGGDWFLVDIVTAVSLTVLSKVGERAEFRVKARNGQGDSLPSNEAIIYG